VVVYYWHRLCSITGGILAKCCRAVPFASKSGGGKVIPCGKLRVLEKTL